MAGPEPLGEKPPLPHNTGGPPLQLRSPTANNQHPSYPNASSYYQQGAPFNSAQAGYRPGFNSYAYDQPPPFAAQPPPEMQDIHPSTNFYRTEIEPAPKLSAPAAQAGLTDEQILNQVDQEKKNALEQQALENMSAEEQAALLKSMFREVGVSLTWRFDDALRNAKQDGRFKYLKMTMHAKKQAFAQYREQIRDEERE